MENWIPNPKAKPFVPSGYSYRSGRSQAKVGNLISAASLKALTGRRCIGKFIKVGGSVLYSVQLANVIHKADNMRSYHCDSFYLYFKSNHTI